MSNPEHAQEAMRTLLENMVGEGLLAKSAGLDTTPAEIVNASFNQIFKVAREDLSLKRMQDMELHINEIKTDLKGVERATKSNFMILLGAMIVANTGLAIMMINNFS
ncbi:MAG: hypothetical protein DIZ78_09485 [endosymbiont of Escarpia spicata]|uniref:Uncharacterized protein n=1 Tax=endosymbiont of Escarpia spicata TaxID=2200908 RepID=A0A370DNA8_9GAMM|nr:MAG: hypothetical protein DIZ78_09485 [endosymbiont of Escarpia spicata]